jgi:hypothetical protein
MYLTGRVSETHCALQELAAAREREASATRELAALRDELQASEAHCEAREEFWQVRRQGAWVSCCGRRADLLWGLAGSEPVNRGGVCRGVGTGAVGGGGGASQGAGRVSRAGDKGGRGRGKAGGGPASARGGVGAQV